MNGKACNVGFVSTRFSGTDGVSLETEKWARTLKELGHECFNLGVKPVCSIRLLFSPLRVAGLSSQR